MTGYLPLLSFMLAATVTPGPNNLMLAASGVAFGFRRTIPHMLGIPVGFSALLLLTGVGVGGLIERTPVAALVLKLLGSAYLLYLAWVMRNAFAVKAVAHAARPLRFIEAAAFQFANPKGWLLALTAVAVFAPASTDAFVGLLTVWSAFAIVTLPSILLWVGVGVTARRALIGERWRPAFGATIAVLMLYSVAAIWIQEPVR